MNLCAVSTFDCVTDYFRAMVASFEEELQPCVSDWKIAVIRDHNICTMLNVTDMGAFKAIMARTKMTEWDDANNCTDTVYSLEQTD